MLRPPSPATFTNRWEARAPPNMIQSALRPPSPATFTNRWEARAPPNMMKGEGEREDEREDEREGMESQAGARPLLGPPE